MGDPIHNPDHYTSRGPIQPIDVAISYWPKSPRANVLKYIARYRDKNGLEDLHKALQYIAWAIQQQECPKPFTTVEAYIEACEFDILEEQTITALCAGELRTAERLIRDLIVREGAKSAANI